MRDGQGGKWERHGKGGGGKEGRKPLYSYSTSIAKSTGFSGSGRKGAGRVTVQTMQAADAYVNGIEGLKTAGLHGGLHFIE